MAEFEDFTIEFELMPKPDLDIDKLRAVAAEEDSMGGPEAGDAPWTYKQCMVSLLHSAPELLFQFLAGWVVSDSWASLADTDG